jgi:hypothetical protein
MRRTAAAAAQAFTGAVVGGLAGVLFGLLYGTLWGALHGDLATVPFIATRFALAGGIAGFLVTTVGGWVAEEGVSAVETCWDERELAAETRSPNDVGTKEGRTADGTAEPRRVAAGHVPFGAGYVGLPFRLHRRL